MVETIVDNIRGSTVDVTKQGAVIDTHMKIIDTFDCFKAQLLIFGNKQYLYMLFKYSAKGAAEEFKTGVAAYIDELKTEENKGLIKVDDKLRPSTKRQKRMPPGTPKETSGSKGA